MFTFDFCAKPEGVEFGNARLYQDLYITLGNTFALSASILTKMVTVEVWKGSA
jgi:hypothetical protein